MLEAPFRITFPIEKAEQREDGTYLVGLASGPEIDSEGERMAPEAIARFAAQINAADSDFPLTYRDAHAKDGVLRDLGTVTRAWITPDMHLGVEVRLDTEDNPAALSLYKQLKKGKQYGMSVAGKVLDYADEFVAEVGHVVRTYKDVVLTEISNTTRPAWTPSFGTVLSKAIKDAAEAESGDATGDSLSMDEELQSAQETTEPAAAEIAEETQPAVEETTTEETTDSAEVTAETADETEAETAEDEPAKADTSETADVEKSPAVDDAMSAAYVAAQVIALLGDESAEGDAADAALLRQALELIQSFVASEVAEIGTPDDMEEAAEESILLSDDTAAEDETEKSGRTFSAANAEKLLGVYNSMTTTLTELGLLSQEPVADEGESDDSEKSVSQDENESTLSKALAERDVDLTKAGERITELEAQNEELRKSLDESTARIKELENAPADGAPALIERAESEDEVRKALAAMSPEQRLRVGLRALSER